MISAFEIRVVLFSGDPLRLLRLLDVSGVCVCGVVRERLLLGSELNRLQPHVVVNDTSEEIGSLCLAAMPVCPPRIVSSAALPQAVFDAMQTPFGDLAAPGMDRRIALAERLLDQMEMPPLQGRDCIARAAAWLSAMPQPVPPLQTHLYPLLAKEMQTSPASIEKRIRTAIETTWLHGSLQAQSRLFGLSVSPDRGKPTNAELLFRLAECIAAAL